MESGNNGSSPLGGHTVDHSPAVGRLTRVGPEYQVELSFDLLLLLLPPQIREPVAIRRREPRTRGSELRPAAPDGPTPLRRRRLRPAERALIG